MDTITNQTGLFVLLLLFSAGALGSLVLRKHDALSNEWSGLFSIAGSLWGLFFALSVIITGHDVSFAVETAFSPLFSLAFHIDRLSAFFIFVVSLIALFSSVYGIGYVKHFYKTYSIGVLGLFYNLFIAAMLLVVSASNGIFFLIAWEIMSVTSYFLVVYDRNDEGNIKAGFLYLIMTHAGTAFIILSFLLFYKYTGSFDFETVRANAALIPLTVKNAVFLLALIGFGTKAGIVPFHIWLPGAHPAAPSHVSALMSGVMIKTGIYMLIRIFLGMLQPVPIWWGLTVLAAGSVSSLLGVLYALTEHDIKRLLAYHSIENIGIILLGLGSALTFSSLGMPSLALLGLIAALFHILNHAVFKSLLFLSAGSVINETHTRNMEEYGGLIRFMPQTAFFFLVGAMAISALPPFNGFFSEWLTFQSLFKGIAVPDFSAKWMFILAAGALAFTGGLALACFVKAFGATFLARPRSPEVAHAKESRLTLRAAMGALAALSFLFGICSGYLIPFLESIGRDLDAFRNTPSFVSVSPEQSITAGGGFASVSAPAFLFIFIAVFIIVSFTVKYLINRSQRVKIGETWDCGTDLTPRMEITATGFARSIILIFKGVLKPSIQKEIEYNDSRSRYLPKTRTVILGISDVYGSYVYKPLREMITRLSLRTKDIQSGNINVYISYIFIALVIALFWVL